MQQRNDKRLSEKLGKRVETGLPYVEEKIYVYKKWKRFIDETIKSHLNSCWICMFNHWQFQIDHEALLYSGKKDLVLKR